MEDKQNDWGKYSSDGSGRVYNEKEIAYLNKFSSMTNNSIDENELYDLIRKFNFNDTKIQEEIMSNLKYIEANGNEYGWNITKGKKQKIITESPMQKHHNPNYSSQHLKYQTPKTNDSRYMRKKDYTNESYPIDQPRSSRNYDSNMKQMYYGDSGRYYNKRSENNYYGNGYNNNKRGGNYHYSNNNNYGGGYDKKINRRPFEQCIEVPSDYNPNNIIKKKEDNEEEEEEKVKHKEEIVLENDIQPEKKSRCIEAQDVIQSHSKILYNQEEEEECEIDNQSTPSRPIIQQKQQHKQENEETFDFEYKEEEEGNEEYEDDEQEEREWRAENLKLYLDKLKNYGKYDNNNNNKAKASSLIQNLEQKEKEYDDSNNQKKNNPEKLRFFNSSHANQFEIEFQQNVQSFPIKQQHEKLQCEKKKQLTQEKIESITFKGYYDTPNRLIMIKNNHSLLNENNKPAMIIIPPQNPNYIPMPYYPPPQYPYPFNNIPHIPPQPIYYENPPQSNPYPYDMFFPMYPASPHYYDIKPRAEQGTLNSYNNSDK